MTGKDARRDPAAGVSLIEMLVVLALFSVVAGAVVLAAPGHRSGAGSALDMLALEARLAAAGRRALTREEPFAIWQAGDDILVLLPGQNDRWEVSKDPRLNPVKLISRHSRMFFKRGDDDLFVVSAALVPVRGERLRIRLGVDGDAYFDGLGLVPVKGGKQDAGAGFRKRVQPD